MIRDTYICFTCEGYDINNNYCVVNDSYPNKFESCNKWVISDSKMDLENELSKLYAEI